MCVAYYAGSATTILMAVAMGRPMLLATDVTAICVRGAPNGFSGCGNTALPSWFSTIFLKNCGRC